MLRNGLLWVVSLLPALTLAQALAADGPQPPNSLPDQTQGMTLFRASCGYCHGADAGGAQGPPLTNSPFFLAQDDGRSLADFLHSGRPASGMPPFPGLGLSDVAALRSFVKTRADAGQSPINPTSILVGDPAAGRVFFEGRGGCNSCHSVTGDLRGIGSRYNPILLQGRIVNPRVVGVRAAGNGDPPQVQVTLSDGTVVSGALKQINDFFVTLIERNGAVRTIARDNELPRVVIHDPAEAHRQMMLHWSDRDLWNVTAYLASLK